MAREKFTSLKELSPKKKVTFSENMEKFDDDRQSSSDCMSMRSIIVLATVSFGAFMVPNALLRTQNDLQRTMMRVAMITFAYHVIMCRRLPFVKISF
jgi:hypothetical protein